MLKKDVQVGQTYHATISGKRTKVRITGEHSRMSYGSRTLRDVKRTHWTAVNLTTQRDVIIKSAAKLSPLRYTPTPSIGI